MKLTFAVVASLAAVAAISTASSQSTDDHKMITPQEVKWGPGPPSIPPGAQAATLYGDPGKAEMFAFRLKLPKDYQLLPHTHPKPEIVTVISGTMFLGMGKTVDRSKAQRLPA